MSIRGKLSVVVPVHDSAEFLRECHASLVGQDRADLEVVYVDDGSSDDSPALLDRFAEEDVRVRVVRQENRGTLIARQAGVAATTGDWLLFVDPDDWLSPDAASRLFAFAEEGDEVVNFGVELHGDGGHGANERADVERYFNPAADGPELPQNVCAKLFRGELARRSFAGQLQVFATFAEDIYAFARLKRELTRPVRKCTDRLYHYRLGNGITARKALSPERYERLLGALAFGREIPELAPKLVEDFLGLALDRLPTAEDRGRALTLLAERAGAAETAEAVLRWQADRRRQADYIVELERELAKRRVPAWRRLLAKMTGD